MPSGPRISTAAPTAILRARRAASTRILTCRATTAGGLGVQATAISLHFQGIWGGGDEDGNWVRVRNFIENVCNFCGVMPVRLKPALNSANDSNTVQDTTDSVSAG